MAEIEFNLSTVQSSNLRYFSFKKELEGVVYEFTLRYLKLIDQWILDVGEDLKGVSVVGGVDLLKFYKHLNVPKGELRVVDIDGLGRDPSEETLGESLVLRYTEAN